MSRLFESLFCAMAWNPDVVSKDFHHCSFRELLLLSIHIACLQLCPPPHCVWMDFTWTFVCIWLQWEFWKINIYFLLWRGPKGQYGNLSIHLFLQRAIFKSRVISMLHRVDIIDCFLCVLRVVLHWMTTQMGNSFLCSAFLHYRLGLTQHKFVRIWT